MKGLPATAIALACAGLAWAQGTLHVTTFPSGVEVLPEAPTPKLDLGPMTPVELTINPGAERLRVYLHKPGFLDTALVVTVHEGRSNYITVHLRPDPLGDEDALALLKVRKDYSKGKRWLRASVIPWSAALLSVGMASYRYHQAERYQTDLETSAFRSDPQWNSLQTRRDDLANAGDHWRTAGGVFALVGAGMGIVSLTLLF